MRKEKVESEEMDSGDRACITVLTFLSLQVGLLFFPASEFPNNHTGNY